MQQRLVSLLLLPCVVLTQVGAALGHAHSGEEPAGHGSRPHFHVLGGVHGCHHCHADGTMHCHQACLTETEEQSHQQVPLSEERHDSDAVYVKSVDGFVSARTVAHDVLAIMMVRASSCLHVPGETCDFSSPVGFVPPDRPPGGYDCPLYVWQLALLI